MPLSGSSLDVEVEANQIYKQNSYFNKKSRNYELIFYFNSMVPQTIKAITIKEIVENLVVTTTVKPHVFNIISYFFGNSITFSNQKQFPI